MLRVCRFGFGAAHCDRESILLLEKSCRYNLRDEVCSVLIYMQVHLAYILFYADCP